MKKKAMALLFAAALLLSCSVLAAADSPANEARNGVVRIAEVFYSDGEISDIWIGTGFFVGQEGQNVQYLVTNHHVVSDYLENDKGEQFLYRDQYGTQHKGQFVIDVFFSTGDFVEAYVVDADEGQDIALLKLEKPTGERIALPLLVPDEKMVGDTVYAVGYPGIADDLLNTTSTWGVEDSFITRGTIGRLVTESGSGNRWIQSSDLPVSSGNSGSPMLTEEGMVIGVVSMKAEEESLYLGANIEPVIDMLRRNAVSFDTAADRTEPEPEPAPEETPAPAEQKSGMNPMIIVGISVLAVAVILAAVLAGRKKKKTPEQEEIGKTVPAAPQEKPLRPAVHSLSAQHSDQKVYLKQDEILVGRSRDCRILFRDGTPGVSGRHCSIAWNAEKRCFVVRDLGSTYGTYLDSGMKLEANRAYELVAGESIYLGEKANTLRLEVE